MRSSGQMEETRSFLGELTEGPLPLTFYWKVFMLP